MSDLSDALRDARKHSNSYEYIRRVKGAVHRELFLLDPDADIEDTQYFNHSAIPDFVLKWSSETRSRDVYLRGSYAAIVAARDVQELNDKSPVLMSLDTQQEFHEPGLDLTPDVIAEQTPAESETLLTDPAALSRITDVTQVAGSPLGPLVRANFLRGGRGLIDEPRAEVLMSAGREGSAFGAAELIRGSFAPDAVLRLERTATLIDMALQARVTTDVSPDEEAVPPLTGRLSASEAAALLPWLLDQREVTADVQYWRSLGALLDLATLEAVAIAIGDRDISRLVVPSVDVWKARRAYLGLAIEEEERPQPPNGRWQLRGSLLTFDFGEHRVSFATNGRNLPGRDGGRVPRWTRLSPTVRDRKVTAVQLRGLSRSVVITAEESENVTEDADGVAASLAEDFSAPEISLRLRASSLEEEPQDVDCRFRKGLVVADQEVSVAELTRLSLTVLAFDAPVSEERLQAALIADGLVDEIGEGLPRQPEEH